MPPSDYPIQTWRVLFFLFWHITRYPILSLLSITLTTNAQWLSGSGVCSKSNRTWVRIPGPHVICYIFLPGDPMQVQARDASYSLTQSLSRWPQARSGGPEWKPTMGSSQPMHRGSKNSNEASWWWASELLSRPPNWAQTPPKSFYFIFHLFYLIVLFNYFS